MCLLGYFQSCYGEDLCSEVKVNKKNYHKKCWNSVNRLPQTSIQESSTFVDVMYAA